MNKRIVGLGAGAAVVAVAGVLAYRQFGHGGPDAAAAAPQAGASSPATKVISLGSETKAQVEPGKIVIAPVTAKQMPPKAADAKSKAPTTQPVAADPAAQKPVAAKGATTVAPSGKTVGADATAQGMILKPAGAKPQAGKTAAPQTQPLDTKAPTAKPKARKTISIQGTPESEATGTTSRLTPNDKATISLLHQLHWLRSNISLWRMRHNGQDVDFAANPAWEQLIAGQVMQAPPVNPFNGFTRVLPVRDEPRPGQQPAGTFGYVYAVSTGKLFATDFNGKVFDEGSVDAVALETRAVRELPPQEAQRQVLIALAAVREQVVMYGRQHEGAPPDFARYSAWEQLLKPTLADGRVLDGAGPGRSGQVFGPYILSMPVNALNAKYKVKVIAGEVRAGQKIDAADVGWVFQAATGNVYAVDASGCVLDDLKAGGGNSGGATAATAQPEPTQTAPQPGARRAAPTRR